MPFEKGKIIDKDFILSCISEEDIFEKYFLPVVYNQRVRNILRVDDSPGCKFYVNRTTGRIRFKDFGKGYNWDCFEAAQRRLTLPFKPTLIRIAEDFGLIEVTEHRRKVRTDLPAPKINPKDRLDFANRIKSRQIKLIGKRLNYKWNERRHWAQYGIKDKNLAKFYVFGFDRAYMIVTFSDGQQRNIPISHSLKELKFAYYLGDGEYKIYFPERSKDQKRFIQTNGGTLQGYHLLPARGKSLVWTKAYKEVIAFDTVAGIPSVATQSENTPINPSHMAELLPRFENHYLMYDNDFSGMRAAVRMLIEYPFLKPLLYPKDRPKDFTDNIKEYGTDKIRGETLKYIEI